MCGKICAGLTEFSSVYFSVKATLKVLTDFGCTMIFRAKHGEGPEEEIWMYSKYRSMWRIDAVSENESR